MPLGAARINTLSKVLSTPAAVDPRTSESQSLTVSGDAKISTAQSKFGGSSMLFDGSGDYVECGSAFDLGTGDFTFEGWFRSNDTSVFHIIFDHRDTGTDDAATLVIYNNSKGGNIRKPYLYVQGAVRITGTSTMELNVWNHLAVVRESGVFKLYVNGTQEGGTYSNSNSFTTTQPFRISTNTTTGTASIKGYMDEVRVSDVARYTSSFTPSTSAFEPDDKTLLLVHGDGDNNSTVILDDGPRTSSAVSITMVDNAHISTDQAKFGSTSVELDGTDDAVDPDHTQLNIGSGDFTVEFFYYPTDLSTVHGRYFFDTGSGISGRLNGYFNSSSQFVIRSGNTVLLQASHGMSTGQWYHLAIVRKSGTLKFYRDGTELASTSNSTNFTNNDYKIGSYLTGGGFGLIGYIDEWRQSSCARYSQAFTAPTSAFVADGYTDLLLHFEGSNNDTTTTDDPPFVAHLEAVTFDGTNNYMKHTSSSGWSDTKQFTISIWFRASSLHDGFLFDIGDVSVTTSSHLYLESDGGIILGLKDSGSFNQKHTITSSDSAKYAANTWYHLLASVRTNSSSTAYFYKNDTVSDGTWSDHFNSNIDWTRNQYSIGSKINEGNKFNGDLGPIWIDNTYLDITVESNRRKFISASGTPVDLGSDGSTPTGSQPKVYIRGEASVWNSADNNKGSTSDYSEIGGTITDSSNEPIG